jgi:hypothetical protein
LKKSYKIEGTVTLVGVSSSGFSNTAQQQFLTGLTLVLAACLQTSSSAFIQIVIIAYGETVSGPHISKARLLRLRKSSTEEEGKGLQEGQEQEQKHCR